jgi:GNAT superfamily N-acetyltransferase
MQIRPACIDDADEICRLVRASIVELCVEDHHNDAAILEAWLANKTPQNVARWLANPSNTNLVAAGEQTLMGAACITAGGEIVLNYVSPRSRFLGVSTALAAAMEDWARNAGCDRCALDSTRTARRFYLSRGYRELGGAPEKFGLTAFSMEKRL